MVTAMSYFGTPSFSIEIFGWTSLDDVSCRNLQQFESKTLSYVTSEFK